MSAIHITYFEKKSAGTLSAMVMEWPELCAWLGAVPPVSVKETAPLVKLAQFGDVRTDKGSLRHDANLVAITGIEGDYDAEAVTPEAAIAMLEAAGIRAVVVTTHSHHPSAPRWRVFAPTYETLAPVARYQLVARLNGALGGILADESFTLSQSYFVGGAVGGEYQVLTTFDDPDDGTCIDLLDKLDSIAIGRSTGKKNVGAGPQDGGNHDDWLQDLLSGDSVHPAACRIVGRMVAQGCDDSTIKSVFDALAIRIEEARGAERAAGLRGKELDDLIEGARGKGFAPEDPGAAFARLKELAEQTTADTITDFIGELAHAREAGAISRSQEDLLLKPLAKHIGVTVKSLRSDVFTAMGGSVKPDHLDWARTVHEDIGLGNVLFTQSFFWKWGGTVWESVDDRVIKQHTIAAMEDARKDVMKGEVDGVADILKTEVYRPGSLLNQCAWTTINVANGTLELSDLVGAWVLREHRRDDYLTTQLPVEYLPNAECNLFRQFLSEVFAGDPDATQKTQCVFEFIGYTLMTTCRFEKFLLLIGSGANGKSVLLGLVEAMVGAKFVAAVQPSQFENRFQRAHLHGKLANIVTEIAEGAEIADAQLKAIVSGELTTAEHKLRDPFDFRPFATCWFGTNHLPHTRDFSDALFRRTIVLTFNNKFEGDRCDPHLKDKLITELPGVLVAALEAVAGVVGRGGFTMPDSSVEAARAWRVDSDQTAQFLEDECKLGPGLSITSFSIYQRYLTWAREAGIHKTLGRKNFTTRLTRHGVVADKGTGGVRMIYGITTTSSWDDPV